MEFTYKLLKYRYKYHVQGSEEFAETFALIYAPKDASFNNLKSTLFQKKYNEYYHEIILESVEDCTILW